VTSVAYPLAEFDATTKSIVPQCGYNSARVVGDNYVDSRDPAAQRNSAFARDLLRSLKPGRPWL
jgi:hypothetical protein